MNARIAPPPIWPGPYTLNGRTVTVGSPSSSWYACARCSPASFETAYVQRASPTEPIVETCPSFTLYACVPKTSLVEKSTSRSTVSCVATAASSTLYVPIRLTRIVRTGLASTVSTPAIAAQWTMCVAPAASSRTASTSRTSACWSVKFGWSMRSVDESASRWRLSSATISFCSTSVRASVVAMNPAPPVMKMRLPASTASTLIASYSAPVRDAVAAWLEAEAGTDEEFVERAWRLVVRREPEPDARGRALEKLRDGTLSRAALLRELTSGEEFDRIVLLDDAIAFARGERTKPRDHRGPVRPRELQAPATSDERAVEIPWCLARYDGERRVLDVGYAFAEPSYLAGLVA